MVLNGVVSSMLFLDVGGGNDYILLKKSEKWNWLYIFVEFGNVGDVLY